MVRGRTEGALFGRELRRLRQQRGLSLRDLSKLIGFTPGYLSKVENGRPPSPELARACDDTLGGGGALVALASAEAAVRPAQLPAGIRRFVGRDEQLTLLHSAGAQAVIVDGPPGSGKTTLALRWAHHAVDRFPDGQLYVDLRGHSRHAQPVEPRVALAEFLIALGVPASGVPDGLDRCAALFRSVVADRKLLVVLDNAADGDQVRPLLPAAPGCAVMITSRERLSSVAVQTNALRVTLGPMTPADSVALIRRVIGDERADAEPRAVTDLAVRCGFLPLALRIAAERALAQPHYLIRDLVDELDADGRLEVLSTFDSVALRTVFEWSYRRLDEPCARLFRLLGLHRGPHISTGAAAALADLPMATARSLLDRLAGSHLAQAVGRDRYQLHDLLREYAAELVAAEERGPAVARMVTWYQATAYAAGLALAPFRVEELDPDPLTPPVMALAFADHDTALGWCDAELPNFVPVVQLGLEHRVCGPTWKFAVALWNYWLHRKPWTVWVRTQELALTAAERTGDPNAEGCVSVNLAEAYRRMGDFVQSTQLYMRALRLRQQSNDPLGEAWSLAGAAFLAVDNGDMARADEFAAQALALFREFDDQEGVGLALVTIGDVHRSQGRFDDALSAMAGSLAVQESLGAREAQSWVLMKMAAVHADRGHPDIALRELHQALATSRSAGDRWAEAEALSRIGDVLADLGRLPEARQSWAAAQAVYEDIGDPTHIEALRARANPEPLGA
ncbi:tetratricopeptide repeat protein [Kutzneria sp. CA-103260]|uniref:tetratricopeptide repeat protein n=1 Tax=Kutzneria sp. CA-103260 TaxID=2802641 RepID=UPI001BEDC949|nr:tetratricopeptide repeat protein [Kutzneria sp. CA-103260]QUQ69575.1 SARP family transcriptional regulator [Kutzneria sp. CA-103260]